MDLKKFRIVRECEEIFDPHRDLAQRLAMLADVFKFIGFAFFRGNVGQPRRPCCRMTHRKRPASRAKI